MKQPNTIKAGMNKLVRRDISSLLKLMGPRTVEIADVKLRPKVSRV